MIDLKTLADVTAATHPSKGVVLIDFVLPNCGPCKLMAPTLRALSEEFAGRVEFFTVDATLVPDAAQLYRIATFPTILILRKGLIDTFTVGRQHSSVVRRLLTETLSHA